MRCVDVVLAACMLLQMPLAASAQDAVPSEMLARTFAVKVGNHYGTAFTIDYKGKVYIVTARHLVSGLPAANAVIEVLRSGDWKAFQTQKTLLPTTDEVDIAVFETGENISEPYKVIAGGTALMGQQVFFLGFPYGLHSRFRDIHVPFIKRGTFSAVSANPAADILYIDGFNNPGFSGGPILCWDFEKRIYRILGVVKGYREDTAKVIVNGEHLDTDLLVNSGILIGYNIQHAIDVIERKQAPPH